MSEVLGSPSAADLDFRRRRAELGLRRPLRIAVSGLSLQYPQTGTGRYAWRVLERLAAMGTFESLVVADRVKQELARYGAVGTMRIVKAPAPPIRLGSYGQKLYWEQAGLRLAAARLGVNALYSPHFSLPLYPGLPTVISIHDLIPLTEPGYAGNLPTRLYFRLVTRAARQATAINTLSVHARGEIERLLGIPRSRIHVIPPGVEAHFNPIADDHGLRRARTRLDLPERYLLYVGGGDVRKNIGVLLAAIARLRDVGGSGLDSLPSLVIAAPIPTPGPSEHRPDWRAAAQAMGLGGAVRFVERIAEEDLPAVYRGAEAFLFPSRSEGFGLPPLEAMACGTPVICSDRTSMPEAVGEAGILLPPDDVAAWAEAISRLSGDTGLRGALRQAGLRQAARFSWDATAQRVAEVLEESVVCAS